MGSGWAEGEVEPQRSCSGGLGLPYGKLWGWDGIQSCPESNPWAEPCTFASTSHWMQAVLRKECDLDLSSSGQLGEISIEGLGSESSSAMTSAAGGRKAPVLKGDQGVPSQDPIRSTPHAGATCFI